MAFRPSASPGRRPAGSAGPHSSLLPPSARVNVSESASSPSSISTSPAVNLTAGRWIMRRSPRAATPAVGSYSASKSSGLLDPAASSSTSSAPGPVIQEPVRFSIPQYLEHSAFADCFVVGSSLPSSQTRTLTPSRPRETNPSSSVAAGAHADHLPRPSGSNGLDKGKGRDDGLHSNAPTTVSGRAPRMRVHLPSRLDVQQCCKRLLIAQDGYGLQFMPERDELGREKLNRHDPDKNAAAVRADYPIPPQAGVYYYEVEVVSRGQMGYIGIGFSTRNVNVERLPGWEPKYSYGYHGDDGKAFTCSGEGQPYGPKFGSGDIIGCGIDFVSRKAFFVKNGNWLGYVFDLSSVLAHPNASGDGQARRSESQRRRDRAAELDSPVEFYPTVGLQTVGERVRFNFGQDPFKFDILSFVKRRKQEMTDSVLAWPIPRPVLTMLAPAAAQSSVLLSSGTTSEGSGSRPTNDKDPDPEMSFSSSHFLLQSAMQQLVSSYLTHHGYSDTAQAFRRDRQNQQEAWNSLLVKSGTTPGNDTMDASRGAATPTKSSTTGKVKKKASKGSSSLSGGGAKLLKSALRTTLSKEEMKQDSTPLTPETPGEDAVMSGSGEAPESSHHNSAEMSERSTANATPGLRTPGTVSGAGQMRDDLMVTDVKPVKSYSDAMAAELERENNDLLDTLRRRRVSTAIRTGDVDTALSELENNYPSVLSRTAESSDNTAGRRVNGNANGSVRTDASVDLLFKLRCRKFIELILDASLSSSEDGDGPPSEDTAMEEDDEIDGEDDVVASALIPGSTSRNGSPTLGRLAVQDPLPDRTRPSVDMDTVLMYGLELSGLYSGPTSSPEVQAIIKSVFSLIAYPDPASLGGQMGRMCSQSARNELAEEINSAMLVSRGRPGRPLLETVWRQAHAARVALGETLCDGRAAMVGNILDDE